MSDMSFSFSRHVLYILYNETNKQTYNGYSVDFNHRLRQHNCEIKGGAKFTTRNVKSCQIIWKPLAIIKVPEIEGIQYDHRRALSCEWHIRYCNNKRPRPAIFNGVVGRLKGLLLALENKKFFDLTFHVEIYCSKAYLSTLDNDIVSTLLKYHDANPRVTIEFKHADDVTDMTDLKVGV